MTSRLAIVDRIRAPIRQELDLVERELESAFAPDIALVRAIGEHLLSVKGKRIRPVLVLLAARTGLPRVEEAVIAAQAIELVHTATLLHDDSIDRSYLRRGLPTVNKLWDDQISVIMGDHLFCKAFKLLHDNGLGEVASILSSDSDSMTYGEMFQMDWRGRFDISEDTYLAIIRHKTASLFASSCEAGAVVGGLGDGVRADLRAYGENIGTAFQIVDDLLDFVGDVDLMGKPVGNDFRDGRITLPLIAALRNARGGCSGREDAPPRISEGDLGSVVGFIRENGGVEYSTALAAGYARKALDCLTRLEDTPASRSLALLAEHLVERTQ